MLRLYILSMRVCVSRGTKSGLLSLTAWPWHSESSEFEAGGLDLVLVAQSSMSVMTWAAAHYRPAGSGQPCRLYVSVWAWLHVCKYKQLFVSHQFPTLLRDTPDQSMFICKAACKSLKIVIYLYP